MIPVSMEKKIAADCQSLKEQGLWGLRRILTGKQGPRAILDGRDTIILTSTNYLGLAADQEIVAETVAAVQSHGVGEASGPRICGVTDIHLKLEEVIASFLRTERALLFSSCMLANIGVIATLVGKGDIIFSDALNHASIVDGCRLSGAAIQAYAHCDMKALEKGLTEAKEYKMKLIVTDGVFSMDGDIVPLPDIIELARRFEAVLVVDDAHGVGVLGKTGRGTAEYFGLEGQIDVITSTLGKAMGGIVGGYAASRADVIEYLVQKARAYRFTNVVPAALVKSSLAAFKKLETQPTLLARLWENTTHFKGSLTEAGFELAPSKTAIVPVMIRNGALAMEMSNRLLEEGVFIQGYVYPVVPKGEERLRCMISAAHTKEDLDTAVNAFISVGKDLHVI